MLRDLLSTILFRKYFFWADGHDYILRIMRLRLYYRGDRAEYLRDYAKRRITEGKAAYLPPGCKVFVNVDAPTTQTPL